MDYLHTMVRVSDIDQSIDFYCNKLGLVEFSRKESAVSYTHLTLPTTPVV